MSEITKKAILVVSFGTSFHETREKTIDKIEEEAAAAYPDYRVYRAWTSQMIIRKLMQRDQIHVDTVKEAAERMLADGITEVLVQPTHVINGIENDNMKADMLAYEGKFSRIVFGDPLLTTTEDNEAVIGALMKEFSYIRKEDALVFMGHGSTHYANAIYAALDYTFKDMGYKNVFMGTVEAYPSMDSLLKAVKAYEPEKVYLTPFMIVAGDHATNDMAGEEEDSWKSQFEQAGFSVECVVKGLGEYQEIRNLLLAHIEKVR